MSNMIHFCKGLHL